MAFDINNFVIDRVVRGVALSKDDSVLFSINQMQNVSLNCASESTDAVDALGTPIATFYRAKSAEFSAENALFDMNLMATQLGTQKEVGSADKMIVAPAMESFIVGKSEGKVKSTYTETEEGAITATYELRHLPKANPTEIYVLNGDSTFGEKFVKTTNTVAANGEFVIDVVDGVATITITDNSKAEERKGKCLAKGDEMFVSESLHIFCSIKMSKDNGKPDTCSDNGEQEQVHDSTRNTNGRKLFYSGITRQYEGINGIIELLENVADNQRDGKAHKMFRDAALGEVHGAGTKELHVSTVQRIDFQIMRHQYPCVKR